MEKDETGHSKVIVETFEGFKDSAVDDQSCVHVLNVEPSIF